MLWKTRPSPLNAGVRAREKGIETATLLGTVLLAIRFVQGWIFWGGGSRRLIYAPAKLDPHAASWMANKLQSAIPGALLGTGHLVGFLLRHFSILYPALILFSVVELLAGLFLMAGFMTRLSSLVTIGLSIVLMLLFGWQGATCIDEWTMASANLAMGITLFLGGAPAFSVDRWILDRKPGWAGRGWFRWLLSGPMDPQWTRRAGLAGLAFTILFVGLTYNYYRGSIWSSFHGDPVSPTRHGIQLSRGWLSPGGAVHFDAVLDAGTAAEPAHIIDVRLIGSGGRVLERWSRHALSRLPADDFRNVYRYNRFVPGFGGITARVGAQATIRLPATRPLPDGSAGALFLELVTINGHRFRLRLGR